jgi:hypothetical protein
MIISNILLNLKFDKEFHLDYYSLKKPNLIY